MGRHVPRIFCETPLGTGLQLPLGEARAHHLLHVLRLEPGAPLVLFDGRGGEFHARITAIGKRGVEVEVGAHHAVRRESPLHVTLAQAISRAERMDYTIQKAVELGVTAIQPLQTEYSQPRTDAARRQKKQAHWREIARSAAEQSGRERVPEVADPLPIAHWLGSPPAGTRLLLDPEGTASMGARGAPEICLLAGAEGGLSADETALAKAAGFQPWRLGPRILRTETAAVAALAVIQERWGDLGREAV